MKYTLGFSPCPNDTFIFDALVNGNIDTKGLSFDYVLEDVETLNEWALSGKLDITKLSFGTYPLITETYSLLHAGSALGKGVGPLLISKQHIASENLNEWLKDKTIAIPGYHTTANLLCALAFPDAKNKQAMVFHEIEDTVLNGKADVGLIIHENRFTYQQKGLKKLIDLGDWWETNMKLPIPLGGIVMKKNIASETHRLVDALIKESIWFSWNNYPQLSGFVTEHAQEMQEDVMRKHIELYVNDYTQDLGEEGFHAIEKMIAAVNTL